MWTWSGGDAADIGLPAVIYFKQSTTLCGKYTMTAIGDTTIEVTINTHIYCKW